MVYPDQLKEAVSPRRPVFDVFDDFLWAEGIWNQAFERAVCLNGTDAELAEAAERLLQEHLLAEPAMAYAAARLLADAGALKPGGPPSRPCHQAEGASGGIGGPRPANGPAVGRDAERSRATRAAMRQRPGVHILCITGPAGGGKTSLADEILAAAAAREGAGPRLRICLSSAGPAIGIRQRATAPHDALLDALVQLGVDDDMPATMTGRRDRYVSALDGQRPVILIDGAVDENQVRPLVPSGDGLVVVTSRRMLTGLSDHAAEFLPLQPLQPHGSRFLARACFRERGLEPDDATITAIYELCGGMPVPTMVVSRWLAAGQAEGQPLGALASRLDAARRAESSSSHSDGDTPAFAAVAAVFGLLDDDQRAVMRVLGLLRLPVYDIRAVSLGTGLSQNQVRAALEGLTVMDLVQKGACGQRWFMDPHIADYASAYALSRGPHPEAEFEQVLGRVMSVYRWRAEGLRDLMSPARLESCPALQSWSNAQWQAERDAYAALLGAAAACLRPALARGLAAAFLDLASFGDDSHEPDRALLPILHIARDAGDHRLQARALLRFGLAELRKGDGASASRLLTAARDSAWAAADPALSEQIKQALGKVPLRQRGHTYKPGPARSAGPETSTDVPLGIEETLGRDMAIPRGPMLFGTIDCAP